MQKNVGSQKVIVFAFDLTDNTPKTGDLAQITAKVSINGGVGSALGDVSPVEIEDGYYVFDLTQGETNGDMITILPESSTTNIQVIAVPGTIYTTPNGFPDDVMVGTNSAALASAWTATRAGYVDELGPANLPNDIAGIPNTAEFNARTLWSADYFDPAVDTVANVGTVATLTGHTPQTGDTYPLASGATGFAAIDTVVDFVKVTTDKFVFTVANQVDSNTLQIEGVDATDQINTACDLAISDANLATSSQVSGIANVGSATNTPVEADNTVTAFTAPNTAFVGGTRTNTYTSTQALDGIYHAVPGNGSNNIAIVYRLDVGGDGVPSSVTWTGYVDGANDTIEVWAWDFTGTPVWVKVGEIQGENNSNNKVESFTLFTSMVGTTGGIDIGKVYLQFTITGGTSPVLYTDQLYCSYSTVSRTVGYSGGAVWIDTNSGTSGTEPYVNGVADNPVDSFSSALTIASTVGLHRFILSSDSTITLIAALTNSEVTGGTLELGGQNVTGSTFTHMSVTGTAAGTGEFEFKDCDIGSVAFDNDCHIHYSGLEGTFIINQVGEFLFLDCYTTTPAGWVLNFGVLASTAVHLFRFAGDVTVTNMAAGDTLHVTGGGIITTASCTGGTIEHNGDFIYTDAGGFVEEVQGDMSKNVEAILADTTEIVTGLCTASYGATTFNTDLTPSLNQYKNMYIRFDPATATAALQNQTAKIESITTTGEITLTLPLTVTTASTDTFKIF